MARLLVVDDDPRIRRLLEVVLSVQHDVVALSSAREALEYLKGHTPDLMILDVMMPEIDGLALLNRIRAVRRLKEVPVVVLTGGGQEFRDPARMLGADVFLEKLVSGKSCTAWWRPFARWGGGGGLRGGGVLPSPSFA